MSSRYLQRGGGGGGKVRKKRGQGLRQDKEGKKEKAC